MAKKPARPLLETKFDFVESLDALIQNIVFLDQCVETALKLNLVDAQIAEKLKYAKDRVRNSLFTEL